MARRTARAWLAPVALCVLLAPALARAQVEGRGAVPAAAPAEVKDSLGRTTPRGTLLGFMEASRTEQTDATPLYLDTRLRGAAAVELAHKLFVVLDRRLPPRLHEVSDRPEGSRANVLTPNRDVVGRISTAKGLLTIVVERVNRGGSGQVWLFSSETLEAIPAVYDELDLISSARFLPRFLVQPRIGGIRLFEWLLIILGLPLAYRAAALVDTLLGPLVAVWSRRRGSSRAGPRTFVPGALRLLLMAIGIRLLLVVVDLPLFERQLWFTIATLLAVAALVWALLSMNASIERSVRRRSEIAGHNELAAALRLLRRVADGLILAVGGLVILRYFGVDPTAALAGLGIGGIAVALAAQKTLENVIGGVSLIADGAVRVGDVLKLADVTGTVDSIGLRSTRIRTMDRTVVTVPNGQIANASLETLSARDKFWFHHVLGLRYETTVTQMRTVLDGIREYLAVHPRVDGTAAIRARFIRVGSFTLDVELFAYIVAPNWDVFLETQQEILLDVMGIIERSGAAMALPSQTLHVAQGTLPIEA